MLFVLFLAEVNGVQLWQLFWLLSTLVLAVIDWDHFIVEKKIFFFTSLIYLRKFQVELSHLLRFAC
ncbi:MAG: hypothetical protein ACTJFI_06115, partial [Enterococcus viikkiensis]